MSEKVKTAIDIVREAVANEAHGPADLIDILERAGMRVSRPTLNRILAQETRAGRLRAVGGGRARVYQAVRNRVADWFAVPVEKRPPVAYRRGVLGNYVPNETCWLGKARLQRLHDSQRPGTLSTRTLNLAGRFMVDLAYASSAMEGNTYTWADTKALVEDGVVAEGKSDDETIMVLNHKGAVKILLGLFDANALYPFSGINKRLVREVHALLSNHLVQDGQRGVVRRQIVGIGGSVYVPETSPQVLEDDLGRICEKANVIVDPYERSFFLMVAIAYLQPFIDVNKRSGRILAEVPLLQAGLAPLSFMRVNNDRYKQGLIEFYEVQSVETIADVYTEAALDSAIRYQAIATLPAEQKRLFVRNRKAIRDMIKQFGQAWERGERIAISEVIVPETVDQDKADDLRAFVASYLGAFSPEIARLDGYGETEIRGLELAKVELDSKMGDRATGESDTATPEPSGAKYNAGPGKRLGR